MYDISVAMIIENLNALSKFLKKAEAILDVKKFDKSVVLATRLFPDMFPLSRQVQLVTDFAKGGGARLAGVNVPSFADEEKTFEDLQARIAKTIAFLKSLDAKDFENAATREVTLKIGGQERTMTGQAYYTGAFLPNFFFHMTTAYNILRSIGVELGKGDFMGR